MKEPISSIDAFPELFASKHPGNNYLTGIADNGREGILPLTYSQLASTSRKYYTNFLFYFRLNEFYDFNFDIGAVELRAYGGLNCWILLIPEQVGQINSTQVMEYMV